MDLREAPQHQFRRHPWEVARLRFFRRVLEHHGLPRQADRIVDVGAGDAWFSRQLLQFLPAEASITCWDSGYFPATPAPEPRLSFSREPPEGPFGLALLLDVLEHVADDAGFLALVLERVQAGGAVLVSVPAWNRLMSSHDAALAHYRRYDPADARRLLERTGLQIQEAGGLFHSLLAPRALSVVLERLRKPREATTPSLEWRGGAGLGRALDKALAVDNALSIAAARRGWELPGLSWWALCRKP